MFLVYVRKVCVSYIQFLYIVILSLCASRSLSLLSSAGLRHLNLHDKYSQRCSSWMACLHQ